MAAFSIIPRWWWPMMSGLSLLLIRNVLSDAKRERRRQWRKQAAGAYGNGACRRRRNFVFIRGILL
ncbi:hypothetical protein EJB05_15496 [Eragrostis curvula]|uniref:Uncharacterized protein n=1 Tax=Eragrostis curvula TaxID=38414 RepID=A0A5J9W243_9POAL|nr:hypothetical protein EJB05_15496 [Eragrostis curvula]